MALLASGIKLPDSLSSALGPIGASARDSYQNELDRLQARRLASQKGRGVTPGIDRTGIIGHDIGASSDLNRRELDDALNNVLGNTSYANAKLQRDYDQSEQVARLTGALNKPSTLEEVLSGLGGGAQLGGTLYGINKKMSKPRYQSQMSEPDINDYEMGYNPATPLSLYGRSYNG